MPAGFPGFGAVADELRRVTVQVVDGRDHPLGSGVIIGPSTIVTNAHVAISDHLRVRLPTGDAAEADLTKRDSTRDLALLTLDGGRTASPLATLRETASLRPGEIAIAAGHPMGFIGAVSTGSVRAVGAVPGLGRSVWVQAAVRLLPGNSGGPLADVYGRVIGINSMVMNGLGLAVPSEAVQKFLSAPAPFRLGVTVQPARLGNGAQGMLILTVEPGSPAGQASLLPGDLITGIDGAQAADADALASALSLAATGKRGSVVVRFYRGGGGAERRVIAAESVHAGQAA